MKVYYQPDYDDIDFLTNQLYYHGTSDVFEFEEGIILPAYKSGIDREGKKSKKVWVTTSLGSAERYANKAVDKFGGKPITYEVEPDCDRLVHRMDFEYTCDFAFIVKEVR